MTPQAVSLARWEQVPVDGAGIQVIEAFRNQAREVRAPGNLIGLGDMPPGEVGAVHIKHLPLVDKKLHRLPDLIPPGISPDVVHLVDIGVTDNFGMSLGYTITISGFQRTDQQGVSVRWKGLRERSKSKYLRKQPIVREIIHMRSTTMIGKQEFIEEVIRVAVQRGYKIEVNARTGEAQINFGHKKLHAGHLVKLYPSILRLGAHIPSLIKEAAPGRPCVHKPMREIIEQLRSEAVVWGDRSD